jgi:tetratricopeptide (TPR) repeat protein
MNGVGSAPSFPVAESITEKPVRFTRLRSRWRLIFALALLATWCSPSPSWAVDPGATAPQFSLANLAGNTIKLAPPASGRLLILYFFDASNETLTTLSALNKAAAQLPADLSALGITRSNPEEVRQLLTGKEALAPVVLHDNAGETFSYGLARSLPAAVLIGPGGKVASQLVPAGSARDMLMAAADAFVSMGLPRQALRVYRSLGADDEAALGAGYALLFSGDADGARQALTPLAGGSSRFSPDGHAALGLLEFTQGRNNDALAQCGKAPKNGFAQYVSAMVQARSGGCRGAGALFDKAIKSRFAFHWQEARAYNMAARTAESGGNAQAALDLYRKAFGLAPLNPVIAANLMTFQWHRGNVPAAENYAGILESVNPADPLIRALVAEFRQDSSPGAATAAQARLGGKSVPTKTGAVGGKTQPALPATILVPDLKVADCAPELADLSRATASLLKQSLDGKGAPVPIREPDLRLAAERMGLSRQDLANPLRQAEIAKALGAGLLVFGEVGSYEGVYILNVRVAEVASGNVVAVASERLGSFDELAAAVQRSVPVLKQRLAAHYPRR